MTSLTCSRRSGSECSVSLDCVSVETSAGLCSRPSPAALTSPLTSSHQDAGRQNKTRQRLSSPGAQPFRTMLCISLDRLGLVLTKPQNMTNEQRHSVLVLIISWRTPQEKNTINYLYKAQIMLCYKSTTLFEMKPFHF